MRFLLVVFVILIVLAFIANPDSPVRVTTCGGCAGSGKCRNCNGDGRASSILTFLTCSFCNGTGDCSKCGGWGYVKPGTSSGGSSKKDKDKGRARSDADLDKARMGK
jgi:hypothetical protein